MPEENGTHSYDVTMSQIRVSVGSFRKLLQGLDRLIEADPRDPRNKKLPNRGTSEPRQRQFKDPERVDPDKLAGLPPTPFADVDDAPEADKMSLARIVKQQTDK